MRILVIEDEQSVASFIRKGLEEQSYVVDVAYDGQTGRLLASQHQYDVILMDIILPQINGLQLCKMIREESKVPILMLTALGTTNDVVSGLDTGADDYLTKPLNSRSSWHGCVRFRAGVTKVLQRASSVWPTWSWTRARKK
jgi:two-component system copper resistance phosphate regulon response regulator CusR